MKSVVKVRLITILIAGLVIAMIPILIVYTIFQKPLLEGFKSEGAVKG